MRLRIETITRTETLEALRPEWLALWARCPDATPFQSPAWLIAWWRTFGCGELLVIALRRNGRLAGIAPFYVLAEGIERKLLLLGAGVSDLLDGLLEPGLGKDGAAIILEHLARTGRRWDCGDLQPLPPGAALLGCRDPAGLSSKIMQGESCPVLALPSGIEGLAQVVPRGMRENLRYCRRRAERAGITGVTTAEAASLATHLAGLRQLHAARWSRRGEPGVLADRAVQRFHGAAAAALLDQGLLRLYGLWLEGRMVAAHYGMVAHGRAYHYIAGFDPGLAPIGLGTILIGHAIEEAVRAGASAFEFLRGREPYKHRWGACDRPTYCRRLLPTGADGKRRLPAFAGEAR